MELSIKSNSPSTDISMNGTNESFKEVSKSSSTSLGYTTIKKDEETERPAVIPPPIDIQNSNFPYCIVWCPIPCITTIFPFIGHTGICDSRGYIHDFAGSYYVGVANMAFGSPCKYIQLKPTIQDMDNWDKAIGKGDDLYNTEQHNLFTNNCHSHCAYILNVLHYGNRTDYTMISIWWMLTTKSKYISWVSLVKTYIGFIICIAILFSLFKLMN